jgi:hypothetical protein
MKNAIGICACVGLSICCLAALMCLVGMGTPNCEPTVAGYVEFWATLFGCGFVACFMAFGLLGLIGYVVDRAYRETL